MAQQGNTIGTVAGGAQPSNIALQTAIPNPTGIAEDANGNIYIVSQYAYRVYEVNPNTGSLQTIAGSGIFGFSGDGGPATLATFSAAVALALDKAGNVYILDGNRLRVVNMQQGPITILGAVNIPAGDIQTVANTSGQNCPDPSSPPPVCGDGGPAANATFSGPLAIYLDGSNNIFIADTLDEKIRFINTGSSTIIVAGQTVQPGNVATLAGNGYTCNAPYATCGDGGPATAPGEQIPQGAKLDLPQGVVTDSQGNIYIGDTRDQRIRCVANTQAGCPNTQYPMPMKYATITTYAGLGAPDCLAPTDNCGDGGPKSQARFRNPAGVWLDGNGNLYIADQWDNRIREVLNNSSDDQVETVCGTGNGGLLNGNCIHESKSPVYFYGPLAVIVDSLGNMTIADSGNSVIRQAQLSTGAITTIAGSGTVGDGGPATLATLANPDDVRWDPTGTFYYIVDSGNNRIRKVANGTITTVVNSSGNPTQPDSTYNGPASTTTLSNPNGIAVDANGNLYIADSGNALVRFVNMQGSTVVEAGQTVAPGNIQTIAGYPGSGGCVPSTNTCGDGGPATSSSVNMNYPISVAVDGEGNVYISDYFDNRIRCVANVAHGCFQSAYWPTGPGEIVTYAGTGVGGWNGSGDKPQIAIDAKVAGPYGLAVEGLGDLYIADSRNNVVRCVAGTDSGCYYPGGTIPGDIYVDALKYLGEGNFDGCTGDGQAATEATQNVPQGVALDPSGNLYLGGGGDFDIRRVDATTQNIMTVAGPCNGQSGTPGFGGDGNPSTAATLSNIGMAVNSSEDLLIADNGNNRIRQVDMVPVVAQFQTKLNFGNVPDGTTSPPMYATMQNYGLATLEISGTELGGADPQDFTIVSNTCVSQLPPGPTQGNYKSTCSVGVTFSPPQTGSYSATLTVNTSLGPVTWNLFGDGVGQ